MSLDAGGHLTHGFRPNISGKMFDQQQYGTDPATGLLDYDARRAQAREFKPLILVAGYSAYPRRMNFAKMREIADEAGADPDGRHGPLRRAGGRQVFTGDENPVPFAHVTTTTTHKSLRGPRGGLVLAHRRVRRLRRPRLPAGARRPARAHHGREGRRPGRSPAPAFQTYAQRIADNAKSLADGFLKRGATLVTGGTDNHLVLLDVSASGSPAGRPSPPCSTPAWSPTATPSRRTRTAPGTPPASGSVPRRSPPAVSATTTSTRSPS